MEGRGQSRMAILPCVLDLAMIGICVRRPESGASKGRRP
jgi:hypothetical protein